MERAPGWAWIVLAVISIIMIVLAFSIKPSAVERAYPNDIIISVSLIGEDKQSKSVDLDKMAQKFPGWFGLFEGPATAWAHFNDGIEGPITKDFGVKAGHVKFTGPAGQKVHIRFTQKRE